jgi:uncharacterized repeat protein (TIGR03943 family)
MARATLMLCVGGVTVRLVLSGGFGVFVQQRMRWPLLVAGVMLVALGAVELVVANREERLDPSTRRRVAGPKVGWLLAAPILVLVAVAPTALGANAADRVGRFDPQEQSSPYPPLPDSDGPLAMDVYDFLSRALWDGSGSLVDREVTLEGIVVQDPAVPDGFLLTRFMVSCCAADALPLQVAVSDTAGLVDGPLADDTWVVVIGTWIEPDGERDPDALVELDPTSITVAPNAPDAPYESPY